MNYDFQYSHLHKFFLLANKVDIHLETNCDVRPTSFQGSTTLANWPPTLPATAWSRRCWALILGNGRLPGPSSNIPSSGKQRKCWLSSRTYPTGWRKTRPTASFCRASSAPLTTWFAATGSYTSKKSLWTISRDTVLINRDLLGTSCVLSETR